MKPGSGEEAFGAPGIAPTWSSSDKDFGSSRLWATIGHGIVNEVYWPSTGQRGGGCALCLAASVPFERLSCGFVGASDSWQDLTRHGELTYRFQSATDGTVAISGGAGSRHGVLALGFAYSPSGAYTRARTALAADFDTLRSDFLEAWRTWGATLSLPRPDETLGDAAELSAAVLKIHEDQKPHGTTDL